MKLYGYWRSLATFRVRIALSIKGIDYDGAAIDLIRGDQFDPEFKRVNPQMVVPALVDGDHVLTQSMAILEYLDEIYPEPPLLPVDPVARARVRQLAMVGVADSHPLVVPRVRKYLSEHLGHGEKEVLEWIRYWIGLANEAIEAMLSNGGETGTFCHGDSVTLADVCLVPQMQGTLFFEMDAAAYPIMRRIYDTCMEQDAFQRAHPRHQPDFPG